MKEIEPKFDLDLSIWMGEDIPSPRRTGVYPVTLTWEMVAKSEGVESEILNKLGAVLAHAEDPTRVLPHVFWFEVRSLAQFFRIREWLDRIAAEHPDQVGYVLCLHPTQTCYRRSSLGLGPSVPIGKEVE